MLIPILASLYVLIIYLLLGTIARNTEEKGT